MRADAARRGMQSSRVIECPKVGERCGRLIWAAFPVLIVTCFGVLVSCGESSTTAPPAGGNGGGGVGGSVAVTVYASDRHEFTSRYDTDPGTVEIPAGSTVRWVSDSGLRHTVTPTGHAEFAPGEANTRGTLIVEHRFFSPGRYDYHCEVHRALGMQGTILVTP